MQKQAVFKVKGMQRDASMANANQEFAYEILNMRLMPAEDLSGFSLTNEKGTLATDIKLTGQIIGQCATTNSLIVFTTVIRGDTSVPTMDKDYIYKIYNNGIKWAKEQLYSGDLNFNADSPIEALFNYESKDIQKVYWIDDRNPLRCINIAGEIKKGNDKQFDSIKSIDSIPNVVIERTNGGTFTAGVIQYHVTYFNKYSTESPILYTSPLLYIAHQDRGAKTNDQVNTAFKLTFTSLDYTNWEYIRIYVTHRSSLDATPEASIISEIKINSNKTEFTDYGANRTSITPTDLYFVGGKPVKAGTMTVKDQVMFLGNLKTDYPGAIDMTKAQALFDKLRTKNILNTTTRKIEQRDLTSIEGTSYYYKSHLNNTDSITHYKYGEKYRFGISLLDKYGNWSNPIWIDDAFIEIPPEQISSTELELPCPTLDLDKEVDYSNNVTSIQQHLLDLGAISVKPLVVYPSEEERKVVAQGVVCPTVYNLKDRKENGPYVQASWFMRPNAPADLWGLDSYYFGKVCTPVVGAGQIFIYHKSDWQHKDFQYSYPAYYGASDSQEYNNGVSAYDYLYDDFATYSDGDSSYPMKNKMKQFTKKGSMWSPSAFIEEEEENRKTIINRGSWVEFRHNYALRSKGFSFGAITTGQTWRSEEFINNRNFGMVRGAEIDTTRFKYMKPVNRFGIISSESLDDYCLSNSAYYVDSSIITVNSPEIELQDKNWHDFNEHGFRIIGCIPLTATVSDMFLDVRDPSTDPKKGGFGRPGLYKTALSNKNIGYHGFKGVVASNAYYSHHSNMDGYYSMIPLFPWNSTGTIGMYQATDSSAKSFLKRKILSNLRFSASTYYFKAAEISFSEKENNNKCILNEETIGWKPAKGQEILACTDTEGSIIKFNNIKYISDDLVYRGSTDEQGSLATLTKGESEDPLDSYVYAFGRRFSESAEQDSNTLFYSPSITADDTNNVVVKQAKSALIKYKSSPHFVVAFSMYDDAAYIQETLPAWRGLNEEGLSGDFLENNMEEVLNVKGYQYGNEKLSSLYHQTYLTFKKSCDLGLPEHTASREEEVLTETGSLKIHVPNYGWLWLGEIYREADPTFGGTTEYALQNNQWENGGASIALGSSDVKLKWTQGDTYYQRFDTLKTYAYSDKDENSVVDITSFMVETRINIDGRTDRNRGLESNLHMSPTNFNLMNDIYSQKDNFFTYRILDKDVQARTSFPNQITWSLTKTAGATVDSWMNITLASVLDLDGTKGDLTALKTFNNNIIAFQEKGLSHIMFNSRAQIATSEAVPIQIANTGKVDGQQYFTSDIGCQDKWSIVTTPNGLYFIDIYNRGIYRFNGQLEDISTPNGFRSWCYDNIKANGIIGYYDVANKEVMYYIGGTGFGLDTLEGMTPIFPKWLGFSELTNAFSSFYTYPKAWFSNVGNTGLWVLDPVAGEQPSEVYIHQEGEYNQFIDKNNQCYGLTVIPRQDSNNVKIFNNVEFRADSFEDGIIDNTHTFDTIAIETEYQGRTEERLVYNEYIPSNLKKKLRTWRANIPRVNNGYNRYVNQWAKVGLWKKNPGTEKTVLHDLAVWYSE